MLEPTYFLTKSKTFFPPSPPFPSSTAFSTSFTAPSTAFLESSCSFFSAFSQSSCFPSASLVFSPFLAESFAADAVEEREGVEESVD